MADRPTRLVNVVAGLIEIATAVAIAGAAALLATQFVTTERQLVSVAQVFTPWVAGCVVVVAAIAALAHRNALGLAAALVGLCHLAFLWPLAMPSSGPHADPQATAFTVVTANILYENSDIEATADALAAVDADVVALAEVTPEILRRLHVHGVAGNYPFRVERPESTANGLVLWSRFPIGEASSLPGLLRTLDADVATPGGPVRFVVAHPPTPVYDRVRWHDELVALGAGVNTRPGQATVVAGDLNSTWYHPPYRQLLADAGLRDVAVATGAGFTPTWPDDRFGPPFATLDHVLVDDRLAAVDTDVVALPGSDHRAVVATLATSSSSANG